MSFLDQLKSQAKALQQQRGADEQQLEERTAQTEQACRVTLHYLQDLARQLSVLQPPGPALTLDGKTPWPPMKSSPITPAPPSRLTPRPARRGPRTP